MTRKFKSGDRVKVKPNTWISSFLTYCVGTVIGYDEDDYVLVKFDDFTNGHDGSSYYSSKGINYYPYNRQHLYVREASLCFFRRRRT